MTRNSKEQSPDLDAKNGFSLISDEKLLAIYSVMLKCRMLEERRRILYGMNNLNGNSAAGREAIAAGVGIDLLAEDTVRAFPGDIIPLFIKGIPLEKLLAEPLKAVENASGIAEALKLAIEDGIAIKASKSNGIAVVFLSGEYMYQESCLKVLTFAGAQGLPILFVSQGIQVPDSRSNGGRSGLNGRSFGFPAIAVEGNDAVAVYRVASEAIAHARKGDGPTLVECKCWQEGDALANMETYLTLKGLFSEKFRRQVEGGFLEELEAAEQVAEKSR